MSNFISFYRECLSSTSRQFCQVGMLWGSAFLFGTSIEVPSPYFLHPNFRDTSLFLIQLLCSSHGVPMILKVNDKDILLNFSVLSLFSFLPRSRILPLVVYNKEHKLSLYSYETLTNAFVSISENVWKPIPCSPCPATSAFFRSPAKLFETVIETESLGHQPALQP